MSNRFCTANSRLNRISDKRTDATDTPGKLTVQWAGLNGPVRVSISYDGGANYTVLAGDVTADSAVLDLPLVKTAMARKRGDQRYSQKRMRFHQLHNVESSVGIAAPKVKP